MKTNRTYYYLYPTIEEFGLTFLQELKALTLYAKQPMGSSLKAMYIVDVLYYRAKGRPIEIDQLDELLFMVFDPSGPQVDGKYINKQTGYTLFLKFLAYCRKFSGHVDDYWTKDGHCIVFKIPKKFSNSYKKFLQSKYSEMYTNDQIKLLGYKLSYTQGGEKRVNYIAAVLLKDKEWGLKKLAKEIYDRFGTDITPDNPDEYDLPWIPKDEYLHYNYLKQKDVKKQRMGKLGVGL